jgi:hypothetical protein
VIAVPPFEVGAEKATVKALFPAVTEDKVGAGAEPEGVTEDDTDIAPLPTPFTARTTTEYVVPFVRPGIVNVFANVPVSAKLPLSTLYSYLEIAEPPFAGTSKLIAADESFPTNAESVGARGAVFVIPVATSDAKPEPAALTARSSTRYSVPPTSGDVPFEDRTEMTTGDAVVPPSVRLRHVAPASVEY